MSHVAIGCDGTVLNTGYKTGVIRHFGEAIGKSLHCLSAGYTQMDCHSDI